MDVGRQRDVAHFVQHLMEIAVPAEDDDALAVFPMLLNHTAQAGRELDFGASEELAARAAEGEPAPAVGRERLHQEYLHASGAAAADAVKARGEDARVVEDKTIAGAEERGQVAKDVVAIGAGLAIDDQHAGSGPISQGRLGDALGGEFEVEVRKLHDVWVRGRSRLEVCRKRCQSRLAPLNWHR